MAVSDYDKTKSLEVQSVTGTPTVDKAQPIYLTSGDDSQTGTGEIVLDWSGISGPEDIAVYDQNDNLLDYEIEELDTTNETGVIWVYKSWTRDGTVQAKVAYGNGPGNNQNVSGTWTNSGQSLNRGYHFHNDPLTSEDILGNNDGTVSGAVSESTTEGPSAKFDGADDDIQISSFASETAHTLILWARLDTNPGSQQEISRINGPYLFTFSYGRSGSDSMDVFFNNYYTLNTTFSTGWYQLCFTFDPSTGDMNVYVDGSLDTSASESFQSNTGNNFIGSTGTERYFEGAVAEYRYYEKVSGQDWVKAEYDASEKGGQTFFSQEAASGGGGGGQSLRSKVDTNRSREDQNRSRQDSNRSRQDSDRRRID